MIPALFFADNGLLLANLQKQAEQLLDVMRDAAGRCGLEMNAIRKASASYLTTEEHQLSC